jgi:hypothetical protein
LSKNIAEYVDLLGLDFHFFFLLLAQRLIANQDKKELLRSVTSLSFSSFSKRLN